MKRSERQALVVAHMPQAEAAAKKFWKTNRDIELDDLISEAYVGLCRAAEDYDPDLGFAFGTYSRFWLRHFLKTFAYRERTARGEAVNVEELVVIDAYDEHSNCERKCDTRRLLSLLDEKEAEILRLRFGLDDGMPRSLTEVGRAFGVVGSTVLRAERRILEALKEEVQ